MQHQRPLNRVVAIVTPYFSPSMATGVHRARHLAKHLPAVGWTPIVLCVDEAYHEQKLDASLLPLTPSETEIIKVPALPVGLSRPLGLGDLSLRAWLQLRKRLRKLLKSRAVSAVLITSAPYYTLLLAPMINRDFKIPVVLDFQDPWVSAWGAKQLRWSKAGLSHRLATVLEPYAVRHAKFITSVSEVQNQEMTARYPWLDPSRLEAIPIGGDPEDFDFAQIDPTREFPIGREGFVELSYVGSFWPAAETPFRILLKALARLREVNSTLAKKIRLNFVGTGPSFGDAPYEVRALAEAEGVSAHVREFPKRLPFLDALTVMARSDGLLLIGSDEPHYTASKIYPALMSGRPYLSVFHKYSDAQAVLLAAGGGIALCFSNAIELAALEMPIAEALRTLALSPTTLGKVDSIAYAAYEARTIARRYAAIFDRVANDRSKF